jgi:hypothetical protein
MFFAVKANAQFFAGIEGKIGSSDNVKNYAMLEGDHKLSYSAGVNVGYGFFKHIPVSIGVEYGELHKDYRIHFVKSTNFFRIPFTVGYCHYIQNFRPFFNIGAFVSFGKLKCKPFREEDIEDPSVVYNQYIPLKTEFGCLGQIGIGYKLFDKLLLSTAFEYNRPFSNELKAENINYNHTTSYFYGAVISANIYS